MKRLILGFIRYYQRTFSLDHGPLRFLYPNGYCKYYPSCSEYGYQAFDKRGVVTGFFLTCWRILRCNPWSKGGPDPVPEMTKKSS
jgi:putative membrane protein insertion efficiency factor